MRSAAIARHDEKILCLNYQDLGSPRQFMIWVACVGYIAMYQKQYFFSDRVDGLLNLLGFAHGLGIGMTMGWFHAKALWISCLVVSGSIFHPRFSRSGTQNLSVFGFGFHPSMPNGGLKLNILNKKTHVFLLINCLCKLLILF